jgi:hypothetical protein
VGLERVKGSGCVSAWGVFDPFFVGDSPVDLLEFVEGQGGRVGVRYPAMNITAWKDSEGFKVQGDG